MRSTPTLRLSGLAAPPLCTFSVLGGGELGALHRPHGAPPTPFPLRKRAPHTLQWKETSLALHQSARAVMAASQARPERSSAASVARVSLSCPRSQGSTPTPARIPGLEG